MNQLSPGHQGKRYRRGDKAQDDPGGSNWDLYSPVRSTMSPHLSTICPVPQPGPHLEHTAGSASGPLHLLLLSWACVLWTGSFSLFVSLFKQLLLASLSQGTFVLPAGRPHCHFSTFPPQILFDLCPFSAPAP